VADQTDVDLVRLFRVVAYEPQHLVVCLLE
jgi:hypothetical protein